MGTPLKIDIHTHILPEKWPDLKKRCGCGGFMRLDHHKPCCARMMVDDKFFREVERNCWNPHVRMHEGGQVQALRAVPVMFSYRAQARHALYFSMLLNDHIPSVCHDFPTRFLGLGTLPLQYEKLSLQELERYKEAGSKGVQIGLHENDWKLNAPELSTVFDKKAKLLSGNALEWLGMESKNFL
ncbi:MAG: hypothetical protein RLZZ165_1545 [Bacteroidota bacterium]|jgi:aminocarboxymuconate-semialdehyde decarboxylase